MEEDDDIEKVNKGHRFVFLGNHTLERSFSFHSEREIGRNSGFSAVQRAIVEQKVKERSIFYLFFGAQHCCFWKKKNQEVMYKLRE